ncbi:unnamed protein product, partial [Didymodactylos carnosus]
IKLNHFTYPIAINHQEFWINRTLTLHDQNLIHFVSLSTLLLSMTDTFFSNLLNNSRLLSYNNNDNYYFIKENFNEFEKLNNLINQPNTEQMTRLSEQFKNSVQYDKNQNTIDVIIYGNKTVFHVRFGTTYDKEMRRLIDMNLTQLKKCVWKRERYYLMEYNREKINYYWTEKEIDDIVVDGKLHNYNIEYRYNPLTHPLLIDDCSNFIFMPKNTG